MKSTTIGKDDAAQSADCATIESDNDDGEKESKKTKKKRGIRCSDEHRDDEGADATTKSRRKRRHHHSHDDDDDSERRKPKLSEPSVVFVVDSGKTDNTVQLEPATEPDSKRSRSDSVAAVKVKIEDDEDEKNRTERPRVDKGKTKKIQKTPIVVDDRINDADGSLRAPKLIADAHGISVDRGCPWSMLPRLIPSEEDYTPFGVCQKINTIANGLKMLSDAATGTVPARSRRENHGTQSPLSSVDFKTYVATESKALSKMAATIADELHECLAEYAARFVKRSSTAPELLGYEPLVQTTVDWRPPSHQDKNATTVGGSGGDQQQQQDRKRKKKKKTKKTSSDGDETSTTDEEEEEEDDHDGKSKSSSSSSSSSSSDASDRDVDGAKVCESENKKKNGRADKSRGGEDEGKKKKTTNANKKKQKKKSKKKKTDPKAIDRAASKLTIDTILKSKPPSSESSAAASTISDPVVSSRVPD